MWSKWLFILLVSEVSGSLKDQTRSFVSQGMAFRKVGKMTPTSGSYKLIIHVNISQINEGLDAIGNKITNSTNKILEQLSFGLNQKGLKSPAPTAKRLFEQFHESQNLGSQLTNWPSTNQFRNEFAQRVIAKHNSLLVEVQLAEKVLNSFRSHMQVKRNKIPEV